jgi:hypothetical protein
MPRLSLLQAARVAGPKSFYGDGEEKQYGSWLQASSPD